MNNWQRLVNDFRDAMDLEVPETPRTLSPAEAEMHIRMIRDEFEKEFVPAFENQDLVEMYDAGIDVIVYVIGALSNAGFDIDPGFKEVMRGNISKMDPETGKAIKAGPNDPSGEPEGKVLKGSAYLPPNLHPIINAQFNLGSEDDTVYRVSHLPLTLGEGGPRIGEADLRMDHNGNMHIEALVEDVDILPKVEGLSILDVYVEPAKIEPEEVVEEVGYDGPPMIASLQEGVPDHEARPVVEFEHFDIDYNHVALLKEDRNFEHRHNEPIVFPPYDR